MWVKIQIENIQLEIDVKNYTFYRLQTISFCPRG